MIKNIRCLHYLTESTYKNICQVLELDCSDQKTKGNFIFNPKRSIYRINLFNIVYKTFGHIWFLCTSMSFADFKCSNENFQQELFAKYSEVFGEKAMTDFPAFENINCEHIEYYNVFKVENADAVMEKLRLQGCLPVLYDLKDDDYVGKPRGKIEFCVSKKDDTHIETLARCHGGILKQRIKDKSFHIATGVSAAKMIEEQIEKNIVDSLLKRYKIDVMRDSDKFDNHISVIDTSGQPQNPTYLRRAKGLVKNGRAEWVNEKTIKFISSPDNINKPEIITEKYKYHCQHQAESFARAIIPVPSDYPLQAGLPQAFELRFAKLCELAKSIYMDMAKQPEAYGLMLVDIESKDHNLARDGYRTIHRFVDTLSNLSHCGKLENHQLIVNMDEFRKAVKSGSGLVSGPVPKYELIFSRLCDFGFVISDFDGKPFSKKVESFTVEYPDYPEMIDTIKAYCDCWDALKFNKDTVKIWPKEFHHHYYRFDYKITADREKIPVLQWVSDEADYLGCSPEQKALSIKFYEHSLQYKDVKFDGDYNYKSKRIARIHKSGYIAMEETRFLLHIRLKNMDNYMAEINELPQSMKKLLNQDNCNHCNFQGATAEHCKFRVHWSLDGQAHEGCAHACFYFDDLDVGLVPEYWRLLELEYGLKIQNYLDNR